MREASVVLVVFCLLCGGLAGLGSEGLAGEGTDAYAGVIYMNGDWVITDTQVRENETIVLTGNLTVESDGILIFTNVTLLMNCTATKQWRIDVRDGGAFYISDFDNNNITTNDASVITANNPTYNFLFLVRQQAAFEMRNSELHECGGGYIAWPWIPAAPSTAWYGMCIMNDNVIVDRCVISYNVQGIILYDSSAIISNNSISWNDFAGIWCRQWSNGTLVDNLITWNRWYGIDVDGGSSPPNDKGCNPLIARNKILFTGRGVTTANPIQVTDGSCPRILDNWLINYTEDAIYCGEQCQAIIENNYIDPQGGNFGIVGSSSRNVYVRNCTFVDDTVHEQFWAGTMWFHVINCTFNQSKVWLEGTSIPPSIEVGWYLDVQVEDQFGNPVPGANVRITDNANGTYDRNFTAGADGRLRSVELIEYNLTQSGTTRYTSHRLDVSCDGYFPRIVDMVMKESKSITITLEPLPVPAQTNLTLAPGWNLVSMPVLQPHINGTEITCADGLADATGCTMLSLWNASGQNYIDYIPGFNQPTDPENFAILEGDAVFLWMGGGSALTFNVTGYEPGPRSVHLSPGWNTVGYNGLAVQDITVWAAQVSCGPYDDICWWDGNTFIHYIFPGTEMQLVPTRGYFVWSDAETWLNY